MKVANVKSAALKALVSSMILVGGVSQVVHAEDAPDTNLIFANTPYAGDLTGNINVVSKYILRGITQTYGTGYVDKSGASHSAYDVGGTAPEKDDPAVQGGLDYVMKNGIYLGYWFSTLGYSYASLNPDASGKHGQKSVENDFYGGYTGTFGSSGIGYTVGGTIYVYEPGWASTGYETKLGLSYGEVSVTAQTLLNDVTFGNTGDTYWLATWTHALPKDFTFTGQVGAYSYGKHGDYIDSTNASKPGYHSGYFDEDGNPTDKDKAKSFAFRHVTLGISHPLPIKGGTWGLQYIIGGDNRFGVQQGNQLVGSLGLTF